MRVDFHSIEIEPFISDSLPHLSEAKTREFKELLGTVMQNLDNNETVFNLLKMNLNNNTQKKLILLRTFYSTQMAKHVSWSSVSLIYKVALGSLLCDIGKDKKKKGFDFDHPARGVEILDGIGFECESVKQIVYQHHENMLGDGYPTQIRGEWIYPPARIVSLADNFVQLMNYNSLAPCDAFEMIIDSDLYKQFDHEAVEALAKILEQ